MAATSAYKKEKSMKTPVSLQFHILSYSPKAARFLENSFSLFSSKQIRPGPKGKERRACFYGDKVDPEGGPPAFPGAPCLGRGAQ